MKDSTTDSWLKLPDENFDAILDQTAASADAKEQLEQLKNSLRTLHLNKRMMNMSLH